MTSSGPPRRPAKVDTARIKPSPPSAPAGARQIDVEELLAGEREILLIHNGEAYKLRLTSNDRLILTK